LLFGLLGAYVFTFQNLNVCSHIIENYVKRLVFFFYVMLVDFKARS